MHDRLEESRTPSSLTCWTPLNLRDNGCGCSFGWPADLPKNNLFGFVSVDDLLINFRPVDNVLQFRLSACCGTTSVMSSAYLTI